MKTLFKLIITVFALFVATTVVIVFGVYILDFLFSLALDIIFLPFYLLF